jgi:4-hydroxy-2-oxoheptanedioate aldolase
VLVELLGLAGFDFVIIDREHGPIDWGQTENLIRAGVSTGISTIVRPPNREATAVAQPLDWGGGRNSGAARGHRRDGSPGRAFQQILPARHAGTSALLRAASYGAHETNQYLANANEESTIIAQVEGGRGNSKPGLDSIPMTFRKRLAYPPK